MKTRNILIIIASIALVLGSCTKNKTVTEKLSPKEVAKLIENDTAYEQVISDIEVVRDTLENDLVLQSKFEGLSYEDYLEYLKKTQDTVFLNEIEKQAEDVFQSRMDSLLPLYKDEIDSEIAEYKRKIDAYSPENYFEVEFNGISKEYYHSSNDVRTVNIHFKITPLRGPIQGGSFRYKVIPKVTNKAIASGGCRFSQYTSNPSEYQWETPYDVEDEFEYKTTADIRENYDFTCNVLTARADNRTYSKDSDELDIPFYYRMCLDRDSLSDFDYAMLIEEEAHVDEIGLFDIEDELLIQEKKKINKTAFELEEMISNIRFEEYLY